MQDFNSQTGDKTHVPCIAKWILNHWTTREVPQDIFLSGKKKSKVHKGMNCMILFVQIKMLVCLAT